MKKKLHYAKRYQLKINELKDKVRETMTYSLRQRTLDLDVMEKLRAETERLQRYILDQRKMALELKAQIKALKGNKL